jgi:hypothetical protein
MPEEVGQTKEGGDVVAEGHASEAGPANWRPILSSVAAVLNRCWSWKFNHTSGRTYSTNEQGERQRINQRPRHLHTNMAKNIYNHSLSLNKQIQATIEWSLRVRERLKSSKSWRENVDRTIHSSKGLPLCVRVRCITACSQVSVSSTRTRLWILNNPLQLQCTHFRVTFLISTRRCQFLCPYYECFGTCTGLSRNLEIL